MPNIYLNDLEVQSNLYPFAVTDSVAKVRLGILTIKEKWELLTKKNILLLRDVGDTSNLDQDRIFASNLIPNKSFVKDIFEHHTLYNFSEVKILQYPWHIFQWNDWAIREDFEIITENRTSEPIPKHVTCFGDFPIFIEKDAKLMNCTLNATEGPIYIGKGSTIMEGACIRGPFALCEGAVVKMGAMIYGATTIGPYSVVGGEIKNSVIMGYSNKAHEGYLGDSVIGYWCNLGAGTSNSNVKNNASEISIWNDASHSYVKIGQKCGLMMGSYSKSAINTSFNSGTIVGICANVFGSGLTPKYIPDFSWGFGSTIEYAYERAMDDIEKWKKMKNHELTNEERTRLRTIFEKNNLSQI